MAAQCTRDPEPDGDRRNATKCRDLDGRLGGSGDWAGSQTTQGRGGEMPAVAFNLREGTAQAVADAVKSALRAGDLI